MVQVKQIQEMGAYVKLVSHPPDPIDSGRKADPLHLTSSSTTTSRA